MNSQCFSDKSRDKHQPKSKEISICMTNETGEGGVWLLRAGAGGKKENV